MNWQACQAFLAVARAGRLSVAARRLGVEHTTIARRIAALEAELDVTLFYRTRSGHSLTPSGQNALAQAEAMERAALSLAARAREGSGILAGRVRLAMAPEFASHWVVPRLTAFRDQYPGIELDLLVGTRQRDLARGEADLAVQSPRPRQQDLIAVRIARTATALYAARSLARDASWRVTSVESLRGFSLLTYTAPFQLLQGAKWFQPLLTSGSVAMRTNSTHALVAAALAGAGVAVLPRFVARWHPELVRLSDDVANQDVWLIAHPEFRRDPKIRAAADFLRRVAGGANGLR